MISFVLRFLLALMMLLNSTSLSAGVLKINQNQLNNPVESMPCHQTKQVNANCDHCQTNKCHLLSCSVYFSASLIYTPSKLNVNFTKTTFYSLTSAPLVQAIQSTPKPPPRFILL